MVGTAIERTAEKTVVHGACPHDCPDTCAMLVTLEAGRAVKVEGNPEHPFTRGTLCGKVSDYLDRVYSPEFYSMIIETIFKYAQGLVYKSIFLGWKLAQTRLVCTW